MNWSFNAIGSFAKSSLYLQTVKTKTNLESKFFLVFSKAMINCLGQNPLKSKGKHS